MNSLVTLLAISKYGMIDRQLDGGRTTIPTIALIRSVDSGVVRNFPIRTEEDILCTLQ